MVISQFTQDASKKNKMQVATNNDKCVQHFLQSHHSSLLNKQSCTFKCRIWTFECRDESPQEWQQKEALFSLYIEARAHFLQKLTQYHTDWQTLIYLLARSLTFNKERSKKLTLDLRKFNCVILTK